MPPSHIERGFQRMSFLFQYGLYASIVPGFLYTVFGTIKEVTIGPTAVNALISYNYAGPSAARALTLAFWTGLIQISLAFFQMGFLLNFVSAPVISAFTSTVAIQVATSQVKGLLGLKVSSTERLLPGCVNVPAVSRNLQ